MLFIERLVFKMKEFIIWKKKWDTGINKIDEQHHNFVEIINQTYSLIKNKHDGKKLNRLLSDITEYARVHFSTEEEYFDETKYPDANEHKQKHFDLLAKVISFNKRFEAKEEHLKLVADFLDFLKEWLDSHLIKVDSEYVPWLKEHGIK